MEETLQTHHQDKVVLMHKEEEEVLNKEVSKEAQVSTVRDTTMVKKVDDD